MKLKKVCQLICAGLLSSSILFTGMAEAAGNGDVNGDGQVTQDDANLLLEYIRGRNVSINTGNADVNGDGEISIHDVQGILNIVRRGGQVNSSYDSKVNAFKNESKFRNGASWSASKRPTLVASNLGSGCNAYARDFVKYVFDKQLNEGQTFGSVNEIRNGDVLKVVNSQHWIVVLYRNGNRLSTAEGNWSGRVVISDSTYTIQNNRLYRNGKPFRTFSLGYHFQ